MHSIWQEKIDFPDYPILKSDKKADVVYLEATLKNAVEAHFLKEQGKAVMILEKGIISRKSDLGGMGILKAENKEERKVLHQLRDYIFGRQIPCEMEVVSENCLWIHPVKLFLFMTEGIPVYEQTCVQTRTGKRLDIGCAYVDAAQIIEPENKKDPMYIYVFEEEIFFKMNQKDFLNVRKYKDVWLAQSLKRDLKGSRYYWEV
ncbi:hypothetical protein [Anaerostipes faecalis]|uniref:hypothetical protein n=1 Tax=Anaerostipes faecalis TaxID=2738446 RepID=UPI001C1DF0B3|nr:hypothetical protein [Anaerostipes faecalis]